MRRTQEIKALVIYYLLLLAIPCQSQDYLAKVQHYGVKEGLSHQEVFTIHQDHRGFIWLGTKYGLNRFDGTHFEWWTEEKNNLKSNEIHHILEDSEGWLWALTVVNWYYRAKPLWISLINTQTGEVLGLEERFGKALPFSEKDIHFFAQGHDQTLFFTLKDRRLFSYHTDEGFRNIPLPTDYDFRPLHQNPDKSLWGSLSNSYAHASQLIRIDMAGQLLQTIAVQPNIQKVEFLGSGSDNKGYYVEHREAGLPKLYSIANDGKPEAIAYTDWSMDWQIDDWSADFSYRAQDQSLWFKGHPNLFAFHPQKEPFYDFRTEHQEIIDANIHRIFFGNDEMVWLGTSNGLYQVELKSNPFIHYLTMDYDQYQVNEAYSCRGIWADEEELFVNTYKGRMRIQLSDGSFQRLADIPFTDKDGRETLLMYYPAGIYPDRKAGMWFSDFTLAHWMPDTEKDKVFVWDIEEKHTYANNIWSIYQDDKDQMWLGSEAGLAYLDREGGQVRPLPPAEGFEALNSSFVHAFVESKRGHIWLGTSSGLYAWHPNRGLLAHYWTGETAEYYLPHDQILHLHEDAAGLLWLATGGGGLIQFQPDSLLAGDQHFRQFTIADGLSNNTLYAVYEDESEHLWMSSDYGIIQFDKTTFKAKAFLPEDGVPHYEFNRISHFQRADGQLFFGGLNGLTTFNPRDFNSSQDSFKAPLQIVDFQQFDGDTDQMADRTNELLQARQITLEANDRLFRLQFALLDYQNTAQLRYAWKLEGQDKQWNHISENFIRVSGLDYGQYVLKIKGQAANGQWSASELHIPVRVLKPFYLQNGFLFLMGLFFLIASTLLYKWRISRFKKQKDKLARIVEERTEELRKDKMIIEKQASELRNLDKIKSRFFANVSHELRTPLTLILGPISSILQRNKVDAKDHALLQMMQKNGGALLKLINEILDLSKLESGKLELHEKAVAFYPLMSRLVAQFESHAQQQDILLVFKCSTEPYLQLLLDTEKFEVIVNNLLSNALKFTPEGGRVIISVEDLGNRMRLEVADTGPGIHADDLPYIFNRFYQAKQADAPAEGGTGIGLALSQELAQLLGGKIRVASQEGQGSTFTFEFPKQQVMGALAEEEEPQPEQEKSRAMASNGEEFAPAPSADTSRPQILLIEDNADMRDYIQLVLGNAYQVTPAEHGQVALKYLEGTEALPDLIISDVMMPVMDGFRFLELQKANDRWRHIPVIMLTARAELDDKLHALRIGVDDYMVKPFEEAELLARVSNLLARSTARMAWLREAEPDLGIGEVVESSAPLVSKEDAEWLQWLEEVVQEHYAEFDFNIQSLAKAMALSRTQLFRRLKKLTGLTPSQYLQEFRFNKARQFFEQRAYDSVKAVVYSVGLRHLGHFSNQFKTRFGKLPSAYLEE